MAAEGCPGQIQGLPQVAACPKVMPALSEVAVLVDQVAEWEPVFPVKARRGEEASVGRAWEGSAVRRKRPIIEILTPR